MNDLHEDLLYCIYLSMIPGVGTIRAAKLIEDFGNVARIYRLTAGQVEEIKYLKSDSVSFMTDPKSKEIVKHVHEKALKFDIKHLKLTDEKYPENLKNIEDPPQIIYYRGTIPKTDKMIAIIGSRMASYYGSEISLKLSASLAKAGFVVVSGMAKGIDSYAHKGCIGAEGKTLAVFGCGVDIVYPPENKNLYGDIIRSGACISEFAPGTTPVALNFPARNRIISGLSKGVVVVEAKEKSGALITVDFALEQGRDVFAVPGQLDFPGSVGTNRLIRDGAKIVTCVEDITDEYIDKFANASREEQDIKNDDFIKKLPEGLSADELKIAELLVQGPLHIDKISSLSGIDAKTILQVLTYMELKGIIIQKFGKQFMLR